MRTKRDFWITIVTDSRIIGILMILSGLVLNRWGLGWLLSPDHYIESSVLRMFILSGQVVLVLAGLWLLVKNPGGNWLASIRVGLVLVFAATAVFGAHSSSKRVYEIGLERGWIEPRVKELSELCDWLSADTTPRFGASRIKRLRRKLKLIEAESGEPGKIVELKMTLADQLLRHGLVTEAIAHLKAAYESAQSHNLPVKVVNMLRRNLGIAYLRSGEISHCIDMHNSDSCLFPLKDGGVWANPAGAIKAIEYFEEFLRFKPDDLGVRWLLNIANMAAGTYPDGLSAETVIPASSIESAHKVGRFREIAPDIGLDAFNLSGGAIMDDFDSDGFLDIVTSSFYPCESLLYYHNNGNGTFDDWTKKANLSELVGGFNLAHADYDNDGLLDIFVLRGAHWGLVYGRQFNSLLRQNRDGTFTDVTKSSGLGDTAFPCLGAAWADYNNDGNIDLYIGNERFPDQLFRNNGDGTFTDVAEQAGVDDKAYARAMNWGDYDNDGDPDLYVSNLGQPNRLYRNNGDGTFSDLAKELGVAINEPSNRTFPTWFCDVNNDGWLDLFVASYNGATLGDVAADYLGLPAKGVRCKLYQNDGTGHFIDVTKKMDLEHVVQAMGANYGDIDNDGFPDFYLGTGAPPFSFLVPNRMYRNLGGKGFADVTISAGVGHLQKGHGIAFGDLDNDGDQDIFAQMGGAYPDDGFYNAMFENPGNSNHWITIKLIGTESNHAAIGARIELVVETEEGERSIFNVVGSGGSFGASSLQQEIGVGAADRIKKLEVHWPASDTRQRFSDVEVDQFIEITEGAETYRVLERKPIRFANNGDMQRILSRGPKLTNERNLKL